MRRFGLLGVLLLLAACSQPGSRSPAEYVTPQATNLVFINEIHYDNDGTDSGEAVEVAGPAGTDLAGWSLALYNGNGGTVYKTASLSGVIPDLQGGYGVAAFSISGIQNGAPDGMALVDASGAVIQFLSYEGALTAADGPAAGTTSTDIGVSESGATPLGYSLQLGGSGTVYSDFIWEAAAPDTFGAVNTNQSFTGTSAPPPSNSSLPFLNELHYDNQGSDINEGIEIAGPAGSDLTGWQVAFYNGSNSTVYKTTTLAGVIPDQQSGYGTVAFAVSGIQNGAPDGLALVDPAGTVVQFWSYEGLITAVDGPAAGLTSVDMGVAESAGSSATGSLQLSGTGTVAADFSWVGPNTASFGLVNNGQTFGSGGGGGPTPVCDEPYTAIYEVQGTGLSSPLVGASVTIEGVVIGDFQGGAGLEGFFLQDALGDAVALSSDGVFVRDGVSPAVDVALGDVVRVTGTVAENFDQTEVINVTAVVACGVGTITATAVDLPVSALSDLEAFEGMLVTFPEALTVTEHYNLGRYGEFSVSASGRLYQPTNDQVSTQDLNDRSRLLVDDGSTAQNASPVPYLAPDNTLRLGDSTTGLTGALGYAYGTYRLQPTQAPDIVRVNARTTAPAAVTGALKVASFNVLNYFTTFGSRGASNAVEFDRQRTKIFAALAAIDADIVGLVEIENNGTTAIDDLVSGLNSYLGANVYAAVADPDFIGSDAIKVAFIYKPAVVGLQGVALSDSDPIYNRPPVSQTFTYGSEVFSVIVNHFKSKGCGGATGLDADQGDGQGCYNFTRTKQAEQLLNFVDTVTLESGDTDVMIIGDLNAYGQEDPIDTLITGGFSNEVAAYVPLADRYSYVFFGQAGYLDHALSSSSLTTKLGGVTLWHINADEPRVLDYNTENNPPELYSPDAYRSSDHDPVIVGLNF